MVKSRKQKGGRISMPSEYYGIESKKYSLSPKRMNCKSLKGGKAKKSLKNLMKKLEGGKAKKSLKNLMKKLK